MRLMAVATACVLALVEGDPQTGMTVSGRVQHEDGRPADGYKVDATCFSDQRELDHDGTLGTSEITYRDTSDPLGPDGAFVFRGLPAGDCTFTAVDPNGMTAVCFNPDHPEDVADLPCSRVAIDLRITDGVDTEGLVLNAPVVRFATSSEIMVLKGRVIDAAGPPPEEGVVLVVECSGADGALYSQTESGYHPSSAGGEFTFSLQAPANMVTCFLSAYRRCKGPGGCRPSPCTGQDVGCVAVEPTPGSVVDGLVLRLRR